MPYKLTRLSLDRFHSSRLISDKVNIPSSPIRFRTNTMDLVKEDIIPLLDVEQQQQNILRKSADGVAFPSPTWSSIEPTKRLIPRFYTLRLLCVQLVCWVIAFTIIRKIFYTYPFLSTVPFFLGIAFAIVSWVALRWYAILSCTGLNRHAIWQEMGSWRRFERMTRYGFTFLTVLAIWLVSLSILPTPQLEVPALASIGDKYFIAINLYNNANILSGYTSELVALVDHRECHAK